MSVIRVWADGQWSDEIHGLDKVYLIKTAILLHYSKFIDDSEDREPDGFELEEFLSEIRKNAHKNLMEGFVVNARSISDIDFYDDYYINGHMDMFWKHFQSRIKVKLKDVETFTVPIKVLREMRTEDHSLEVKYDEIISASKAPASTPDGYCVNLRFGDE